MYTKKNQRLYSSTVQSNCHSMQQKNSKDQKLEHFQITYDEDLPAIHQANTLSSKIIKNKQQMQDYIGLITGKLRHAELASIAEYTSQIKKPIVEKVKPEITFLKNGFIYDQEQQHLVSLSQWLTRGQQISTVSEISLGNFEVKTIPTILNDFASLRCLNLSNNNINKIQNLISLKSLQQLFLCSNNIRKLQNLHSLSKLKKIFINDNKIQVIENLEPLTQLEFLGLNGNLIRKIDQLHLLTSLKNLYLSKNKIYKIQNLESLTRLQKLNLSQNSIHSIENILLLENLCVLQLDDNLIYELIPLNQLQKLEMLSLINNPLMQNLGLSLMIESLNQRGVTVKTSTKKE